MLLGANQPLSGHKWAYFYEFFICLIKHKKTL